MQELRRLLSGLFECLRSGAVERGGNLGLLGVVNSVKVTSFLSRIFSKARVVRAKERLGLGQTWSSWPENAANVRREKKFAAT